MGTKSDVGWKIWSKAALKCKRLPQPFQWKKFQLTKQLPQQIHSQINF